MMYERIRYFLKAAECHSLSEAARKNYISPQAMTKQINLLETELGGELIRRSPKGIELTEFGNYAWQRLSQVDHELERAWADIKAYARDARPRLRIGIMSVLPQEEIVSPLISELISSFPQYQLALSMLDLSEGKDAMLGGSLDMLITNTHMEDDWDGCRLLSFRKAEAKVIVSMRHPWAIRDHITAEDMRQYDFLKVNIGTEKYRIPLKDTFYHNIPCRSVREVANVETLFIMMQQGEGFGVFPMVFHDMDRAKIKCFDYPGQALVYHTALVYRPDNPLPGFSELIRDLQEEFDLEEITEYA